MQLSVFCTVFVVACVSAASIGRPGNSNVENPSEVKMQALQNLPLERSRRWILSWVLGYGFLPNLKNETETRNAINSDVEVVKPEGYVDLSSDTRVNYVNGNGRTEALASEGDAEVFDWRLLQEDRARNSDSFSLNPHYYEFHPKSEEPSQDLKVEEETPANGLYSRPYGVREVSATGFLGGSSRGSSRKPIRKFNRTPIAYDESMQYVSPLRQYRFGRV